MQHPTRGEVFFVLRMNDLSFGVAPGAVAKDELGSLGGRHDQGCNHDFVP